MPELPPMIDQEPTPDELASDWMQNDRRAEWGLRRMREIDRAVTDIDAQADVWISEIREWLHERIEPLVNESNRIESSLLRYALAAREHDGRKTVKLPSGTLSTKQAKEPVVSVVDPKAVLEWAKANVQGPARDDVIKVDESIRISELRKVVEVRTTEDGDLYVTFQEQELVPGVAAELPASMANVALDRS